MLSNFLTFINTHQLFSNTDRILLAVSGGIDSIVMSELFHVAKTKGKVADFAMAHCNFGLRGEESDADELFVKKLAKKYKAKFYSENFETQAFADQEKISIQMAARLLRYRWFDALLAREGYQYLATAHHQNDTLETVLLNLTRGTGISGLHGIRNKNGHIIRPIGFADREMIYDFVVEQQLAWREDSSNESNKYHRNLIRNEVVPLLKQINPNLEQTIQQTVEKVQAVENVFQAEIDQLRTQLLRQEGSTFQLEFALFQSTPAPLMKLFALLQPFQFTYGQVKEILESLDKEPGKTFLSPTNTLVKDRTTLVITPQALDNFVSATIEENQAVFESDGWQLTFATLPRKAFKISTGANVACLDANTLQFPLKLRKWKEGDWFCPLGMNQKKKISDFLVDEKVPLNLKSQVRVLTSNGSIVWIVGYRIDNRFKITDKTERVLLAKKG
ncbi:MAG: tRNA lysidine(34) synthetase TilS [Bacteroidota bacterium]